MLTLLASVHVLIGICLVLFVLLQDPKGGAMGVFSGGSSSNTFFGSSGATNFLTTTTKWLAVLFAASCLTLTYICAKKSGSVMDSLPSSATAPSRPADVPPPSPATPATPDAPVAPAETK
ncbi:MAG: preprotein translocase subunit SecG [Bdellovibrionales bacterium]